MFYACSMRGLQFAFHCANLCCKMNEKKMKNKKQILQNLD